MHTTWRVTAAHGLLGVGALLALAQALAAGTGELPAGTLVAWLTAASIAAGLTLSWSHEREVQRFRRRLTIGLTHHMRTSLAHIRSYNEMLLLGHDSSEAERTGWLEIIEREAERLGTVVENLLMIVDEKRRDAYPIRSAVDLGAMLEDVACGYGEPGGPRLRFGRNPPAGVTVNADPAALRLAIGNLLQGIGSRCEPGGDLSAELTTDGKTATVVVDLGRKAPGSKGQNRAEPDRSSLEGGSEDGFDLELAVVRHVARAHGGRALPHENAARTGYRLELPIFHA